LQNPLINIIIGLWPPNHGRGPFTRSYCWPCGHALSAGHPCSCWAMVTWRRHWEPLAYGLALAPGPVACACDPGQLVTTPHPSVDVAPRSRFYRRLHRTVFQTSPRMEYGTPSCNRPPNTRNHGHVDNHVNFNHQPWGATWIPLSGPRGTLFSPTRS
jgi:hypothetical protein